MQTLLQSTTQTVFCQRFDFFDETERTRICVALGCALLQYPDDLQLGSLFAEISETLEKEQIIEAIDQLNQEYQAVK